jgi:hypothetical protein
VRSWRGALGVESATTGECQSVSLAAPLSWAVSDADRGMTRVRRRFGGIRTSRGVDALNATRVIVRD